MDRHDVILTGIPRSGTTLVCALLNKLPDTVALNEPLEVKKFRKLRSVEDRCDLIQQFFRHTRRSLIARGLATSKQYGGTIPDNNFADEIDSNGTRPEQVKRGEVNISKDLSPDFLLCIKNPGLFTGLLDGLVGRYPTFAVIRNPLAVLASWNTLDINATHGHSPAAERFHPDLARALARCNDRAGRQMRLLSWFYERYSELLPPSAVLRYEDIVASEGRALTAITQGAEILREPLENRNASGLYGEELRETLAERLLRSEGAYWRFYPKASVEALL
jgi:hypothetical protein